MRLIVVGQPFHPDQVIWPEGAVYTIAPDGHNLALFVDEPTSEQAAAVASGDVELGLGLEGPILLLLYRFGDAFDWSDAPLHWGRVAPASRPAAQLAVALVDAFTGVVRAVRSERLPDYFALEAATAVAAVTELPWPGDDAFDDNLRALYASASSDELALRAFVTCRLEGRAATDGE